MGIDQEDIVKKSNAKATNVKDSAPIAAIAVQEQKKDIMAMKSRSDKEYDQGKTFSASSSSSGTLAIDVAEAEHTKAQCPNTGESAGSKEAEPNQRSKKDKTHIQDHISEGNVRE